MPEPLSTEQKFLIIEVKDYEGVGLRQVVNTRMYSELEGFFRARNTVTSGFALLAVIPLPEGL